jgi:hypothetical protein
MKIAVGASLPGLLRSALAKRRPHPSLKTATSSECRNGAALGWTAWEALLWLWGRSDLSPCPLSLRGEGEFVESESSLKDSSAANPGVLLLTPGA